MRDEIRRAYIKAGPYQPILSEYPASNSKNHPRYFQPSWFKQFSWLECSPSKDVVFCLPCFLFNSNPTSRFGLTAFTHNGFSNWKKVHNGCNCAFLTHTGKDPNSLHNNAQRAYVDLMNQAQHIEVSLDRKTTQQISANRLRLKTSIDVVRWLSFQWCAFRGHDESSGSKNRGNFLELLSLLASYDEKVKDVLKNAPQNASYTSSTIQKEILQIYANRVRNVIHEEIGDRKFSIIVDEARDESKKEQMAIILRFVDKKGQVKERFFDIVHVKDTALLTLNNVIFNIGTLQLPGETRWSSHLNSVTSLLKMYNATSTILENLKNTTSNYSQRGDAHNAYNSLRSFEFIFILHVMKEVLGITDKLCQALQRRSQDILNAMSLLLTTKDLIQKLRDDGWNELLKNVISFCESSELDFPNMNAQYIVGRSHNKKEDVTVEHHYRVDIFFATIDTHLQELKSRFNENVVELLTLTIALDPKEFFKLFDIDKICILVNKFYPEYFSQQEKERLPYELKHYELDSVMYPLVDRLICLILTLPVSTTSLERAFSAMKIVKTRLRSKMKDDFLKSSLVMYIEKEIAEKFDINEIIDDFSKVNDRGVQFK
ncbi:hypothetical protein ES332_A03G164000v1 [Gossypium tomentosum]|uniref:TTF-type domain-containing protein n=1 Tax=Gossypium tomentosum TaxID=34277 RepID=A0A5D2R796_GOSTO|nr:hypothetical protein ES332_A03G164000v1 [Gossypium tomentosum]